MSQRDNWICVIPADETAIAVGYLVATWKRISGADPDSFRYTARETQLTELLQHYLRSFLGESGLTGFWIGEAQDVILRGGMVDSRIKKDITYCSNAAENCRLELIFEVKKLSKKSLSIYQGKEGMGRFVEGGYASKHPLAVMVGILASPEGDVLDGLRASLAKKTEQLKMVPDLDGHVIRRPSTKVPSVADFDTEHRRSSMHASPSGVITIVHTFLSCAS